MTDDNGAVVLGDSTAGNSDSDTTQQLAGEGSLDNNETNSNDFSSNFSGLSEGNQKFMESKGVNGPEDLDKFVSSYSEMEKLHSANDISPKGDEISQDEWGTYAKRNGALESAEAYEFTAPKDMPDHVVYNDDMATAFKPAVHKAALNPKQAQILHDEMSQHFIDEQVGRYEAQAEQIDNTGHSLLNEWGGSSEHPLFQENVKQAFRSIKSTPGLLEAYVSAGLMVPIEGKPGQYNPTNPDIILYHASAGKSLHAEAGGFDGMGGGSGKNPFVSGSENLEAQASVRSNDPETARALIRQAGRDPREFGL